jgi:spermidine/putrescine transport system permease protein
MSLEATGWGWRGVQFTTVLVYIFMFAPIIVVVVLSFNSSMFGGFPMTGLSLRWYEISMPYGPRSAKAAIWPRNTGAPAPS